MAVTRTHRPRPYNRLGGVTIPFVPVSLLSETNRRRFRENDNSVLCEGYTALICDDSHSYGNVNNQSQADCFWLYNTSDETASSTISITPHQKHYFYGSSLDHLSSLFPGNHTKTV